MRELYIFIKIFFENQKLPPFDFKILKKFNRRFLGFLEIFFSFEILSFSTQKIIKLLYGKSEIQLKIHEK